VKGVNRGVLWLGSVYRFSSSCSCLGIGFEHGKTEAAFGISTVQATDIVDVESDCSGGDVFCKTWQEGDKLTDGGK
jgi:hypothetical protein